MYAKVCEACHLCFCATERLLFRTCILFPHSNSFSYAIAPCVAIFIALDVVIFCQNSRCRFDGVSSDLKSIRAMPAS